MGTDWLEADKRYDDPEHRGHKKLQLIKAFLSARLIDANINNQSINIINIGSGTARETLDLFEQFKFESEPSFSAYLIDTDKPSIDVINERVKNYTKHNIYTYNLDAGISNTYIENNIPKADIVIIVAMFSNLSDEDTKNTIFFLKQICKTGAYVFSTKNIEFDYLGNPISHDPVPDTLKLFEDAGFVNKECISGIFGHSTILIHEYLGEEESLVPDQKFFTFVE